jgi:broad specificity phosphatase PhoE
MKLILIRHGESAKNRGYEVSDEENFLTAKGVEQAMKLGTDLLGLKIDAIYCSSAPRCEQTLDEILRNREDEMPIHFSPLIPPKLRTEKYEKLKARVELFLNDLKYDHKNEETVAVISHQLVLAMMILKLKQEPRRIGNGEMVVIDYSK